MLKTLWGSIREYRKTSLLTMALSMTEVVFEIIIPLCMAKLIDLGIEQNQTRMVWLWGGILLALALLQMGAGIGAAHTGARSAVGFAANIRQDMFDKVQSFAFSNIDKFSAASIVTRLTTDVTNVQNAYQMLLRMAVRAPSMIVFAMAAAIGISRQVSLVFFAVIPVLSLGLFIIIRTVYPRFRKVFETYDDMNRVVEENVRGIRVVKAFQREDREIEKFGRVSETIFRLFSSAEKLIVFNMPLMQLCMYANMLLISWLGAKAVVASGNNAALGLTTGGLTALFTYSMQVLMSLMMLSMVFVMITIAGSSAERIAEILREEPGIKNPAQPVTEVKNGDIEFQNVDFVYSKSADKKVLDGITLSIRSGETVGILGGTGSSKSSLVQLIPRLYDVTGGALAVGGVDVRQYDLTALRNSVAMVLQKNELFSGTIRDNLKWGNENATEEQMRNACRLACADDFITAMPEGYDTKIEQGGANVSGGQKQRLCIARALLKDPKVLILDDSTSAVDMHTDFKLRRSLSSLMPDTTKIIIAQRIHSVMDADRIVVMDDGRIAAQGTHEELLKSSPIYREVYESQQKGDEAHE